MNTNTVRWLCTTIVVMAATIAVGEDKPDAPAKPSRAELRDKQYDVSLDARDIERILTRLKRASELSKQRMTEAATAAESVSGSIERGDSKQARERAEETSKMFQEIAKQLEALLTEETPQRVAAARNLAAQLAKAEQQFAQQAQKLNKQMQDAPTAGGKSGTNDQPPKDPKQKGGQGKQAEDSIKKEDQPKDGGNDKPQADQDEPNGDKGKDEPKNEGAGKEPMDKEMPDPTGTDGANSDKNKDDKGGSGGPKPEEKKPDENGSGAGQKPDEKKPNEDGGGSGDGKDEPEPKKNQKGGSGKREPLTPEERQQQLADRASDLANRAATLLDILEAIAASEDPADKDAAGKVAALLKETDLKNAMAGMQAAADEVRNQKFEDAQATALDLAERLQITTQRLDAVYRAIVGPQAEELRKLEQQLLQLREKLEDLQTPAQITAWHRAVRELLDKADELGISEARQKELLEEMKKQGFNLESGRVNVDWQLANGRYAAPEIYTTRLVAIQEEIQSRIQNLLIGEFASMTDDLAPPQYQNLVERYYQVLSRDSGTKREPVKANPATPKP